MRAPTDVLDMPLADAVKAWGEMDPDSLNDALVTAATDEDVVDALLSGDPAALAVAARDFRKSVARALAGEAGRQWVTAWRERAGMEDEE